MTMDIFEEAHRRIATKTICKQLLNLSPLDQLVIELRYRVSTTLMVRFSKATLQRHSVMLTRTQTKQ